MYTQFGQRKLLPQVLVNLIWMFDDRYRVLFRDCVDEMHHCFYKNRLKERLSFEFNIFNSLKEHSKNCAALNQRQYSSNQIEPDFSIYILNKMNKFGDGVPNENLPHFVFKNLIVI